jgi:PAS domain S-box-containing protein
MVTNNSELSDSLKRLFLPVNLLYGSIAVVILISLYIISLQNYILFHGIVELAGITVAFSIFILVWNTRSITDTFFLIVGISFLFTGSLDLIHTLAYRGMGVFPGNSSDLPTELWIAARYFQSITFFIATFFTGKSITRNRDYDAGIIFAACTVSCGFLLASIFIWDNFPASFIEGSGLTPFKIISEYIISLILIATIILIVIKRQSFESGVWQLLIAAQIFLILGELAFTSYISVYGFMNMLGHLFRLISVYLFYRAFVVVGLTRPYDLLLRELKKNETALRIKSKELHTIIDQAPAMIFYKDTKNNFIKVNPAGARAFGFPVDKIEGKNSSDLFPDFAEKYYHDDLEVINSGKPKIGIVERMTNASGERLWVQTDKIPLMDEQGTITGILLFVVDITERKRTEDALALASKKLNLLSSVTRHDINNQLMSLNAYIHLSGEAVNNPAELKEFFAKEQITADAIAHQIRFTRDYEDLGVKAPAWQNLDVIIRSAVARLPMREIRAGVEDPGLEVLADLLLEKVFYNLIDNALRYGGEKLTSIRVASRKDKGDLVITVEDDGNGISVEDKKMLFNKGFGKHTGLGLFLSREILSITGITITETGDPGTGARFEITVPDGAYRFKSSA